MKFKTLLALLLSFALIAAACGGDDDDAASTGDVAEPTAEPADAPADDGGDDGETTDDDGGDADAPLDCSAPPVVNEGQLTVATGETVFPPWMGAGDDDFDDPSTGTGYEGALVFALADQLGFDTVEFVRTGFDEVIAPGEKDWDFNIQQYSITAQRDEVVDFSTGYYQVEQAIIGASDSAAASATSIDDLKGLRLGAALGSTSLDYIDQVIQPDDPAQVYDDNAAAKAAFDAGQVDGIVFDLPTAYFITAVEITDASIIGVLPRTGDAPEELGMLFEDGNPFRDCVNDALAALEADGTLASLEDQWLNQGGDIPTLAAAGGGDGEATGIECAADTVQDGVLTVATGETVFPPWMGAGDDDFDDPSTGTGYEGALVFALADQLGFDTVEFVRTGFDEVIAPGEKDWDFNIQQYSITAQRDEVVDFSTGYYQVEQAIIGASDSAAASATSIDDLKGLRLGAALGSTSLDYIDQVIQPDDPAQVYDDNAAAKAAFDAGQVDGIVFDLPTAYFITAVEITDASIIGVLPRTGDAPEELGMLFEDGNPFRDCVNDALAALEADGTLASLEDQWLNQGGDIPTLAG